ncbi:fumarate reductase/succinate dehydrogenase flavoprotein subunit [Candidatus Bathyarchaeota archaeon]|nr:MAG: fumarate reductase/succinate dehydrogenase flavoprotein subunit [Candidatus Bathyarchaeota archaeon]
MSLMRKFRTDVLIIGGGGAGSRAAIEADKLGVDVTILCKGEYGESGCTPNSASEWMAYGVALGIADPRDSCEVHFRDIVEIGAYVCDQNLAKIIAYEAPSRFFELVDWGVNFLRDEDGRFRQFMSDGASYPRACGTGADTGRQIMNALKKIVNERGIRVLENTMAVDLVMNDGRIVGAVAIDVETLEPTFFEAKSTVISTGGAGSLFLHNVFPDGMTGDGYAMALRAGAKLVNMEFMQIGPCVTNPFKFDVGGILWRLSPRLINGRGEEYLKKYLPVGVSLEEAYRLKAVSFPFTMRNASGYIDIANFTEIIEGRGTKNRCVYFDLSHIDPRILETEAQIPFRFFLDHGIDIRKEPLEIAPAIQHMNGGILINERAEAGIPGLYAAGEAAGGQHGADRPGGNSLADCQVFGARAGRYAAERALKTTVASNIKAARKIMERVEALSRLKEGVDIEVIREEVKETMWKNVSVVRRGDKLAEAVEKLLGYRKLLNSRLNVGENRLIEALELRNMIDVGLAIAKTALTRRETRGSHYRVDYPSRDDSRWMKMIEIQISNGTLSVNVRSPIICGL